MTSPSTALAFPRIDQDALEKSIASQQERIEGKKVKARVQIMLEDGEAEAEALTKEQAEMRADIARLKGNIQKLEAILELMEQNEKDVTLQLATVLQSNHSLKQAGVTIDG